MTQQPFKNDNQGKQSRPTIGCSTGGRSVYVREDLESCGHSEHKSSLQSEREILSQSLPLPSGRISMPIAKKGWHACTREKNACEKLRSVIGCSV
jgi:hypothetical protein